MLQSPLTMTPAMYAGANALGLSRYANPQHKVALESMVPAASSHDSVIATKEQIAAACGANPSGKASPDATTQLAIAQEHALKAEVEKHAAKLSRTVSAVVVNTRKLLALLHESLQKEGVADTKPIDGLWAELEQLVAAAGDAKAAMPVFLEKQRNNMGLYHSSMLNETIRDTQEEVDIQQKKIRIQHNLILEQQEAFQEYKAQTASKLKKLEELQERVSRLTLERGNFRTDIDSYKHLLEKEQELKAGEIEKVGALEKELGALRASKTQLLEEANALRETLRNLQEQMQLSGEQSSDKFAAELKAKADQLAEEAESNRALKNSIEAYKTTEATLKIQADNLKQQNTAIKEKYSQQAAEHAQAFSNLSEQTKKVDALISERGRLRDENDALKQTVTKLSELETQNADLSQAKSALATQIIKLSAEADAAKKEGARAKIDSEGLKRKLAELEKAIVDLESENKDLLAEHDDDVKMKQEMQLLKSDPIPPNPVIPDLRISSTEATGDGSRVSDKDKSELQEMLVALEKKNTGLETALDEWTELAKRSYKQYKEMLPMYKQADQHRRDSLGKDSLIKELRDQLSAAKTLQSNGVSAGGDTADWKIKFATLL